MRTLVRTNHAFPTIFGNVMNDFFTPSALNQYGVPAVNIIESNNGFWLELAAPGLSKEDFKLHLENNVLTVSAQKEQKTEETTEKFTRKEFSFGKFQRSFTLPQSVNSADIQATYVNGILRVELPKKEETKPLQRLIEIA
ncbi:MAG: Hsp20/alpha crystallin family protein [Runella slithyformis]|nr:MAG: Hsp20/alpha crystallin family protein [Runella sp.]TAG17661.1 MAG: Hsp20/alpha crystallin family protein [Cytophagales bacterium]TAG40046.1 MAG: Hsp20/alpha crystallin family protein [Cytophagia bacterium]TAG67851.1 MAG: Hsp20/alpha crystallin family protein [Runella slithyformis]TAG78233.1 MAG: Hsp20/alpha crystallin family protein [Cytophagales bacterium]